jgi:hypothetical protein
MGDLLLTSETVTEIILVLGVSFIGSSIHEYVFRSEDNRSFFKNPNIWISTVVSSIICYTINPLISDFNPRLMLLPPLLVGMAGMDLVRRLVTTEGSSSLIEYILGFFGVTNKKTEGTYGVPPLESHQPQVDEHDDHVEPSHEDLTQQTLHSTPVLPTNTFENLMSLDAMVQSVLDGIADLIIDYYVHKDKEVFLHGYVTTKNNMRIMRTHMLDHQFIPISTALKLSEIIKKEEELNKVYVEVTNQGGAEAQNTTSN